MGAQQFLHRVHEFLIDVSREGRAGIVGQDAHQHQGIVLAGRLGPVVLLQILADQVGAFGGSLWRRFGRLNDGREVEDFVARVVGGGRFAERYLKRRTLAVSTARAAHVHVCAGATQQAMHTRSRSTQAGTYHATAGDGLRAVPLWVGRVGSSRSYRTREAAVSLTEGVERDGCVPLLVFLRRMVPSTLPILSDFMAPMEASSRPCRTLLGWTGGRGGGGDDARWWFSGASTFLVPARQHNKVVDRPFSSGWDPSRLRRGWSGRAQGRETGSGCVVGNQPRQCDERKRRCVLGGRLFASGRIDAVGWGCAVVSFCCAEVPRSKAEGVYAVLISMQVVRGWRWS